MYIVSTVSGNCCFIHYQCHMLAPVAQMGVQGNGHLTKQDLNPGNLCIITLCKVACLLKHKYMELPVMYYCLYGIKINK